MLRSGLTRHDPAMMVVLVPWTAWLTGIGIMWSIALTFFGHRVLVAGLIINAGVGIWLGATEDPFMYISTVVMTVVLATWWSFRAWGRARAEVGDQYLHQTGLAGVYADLLTATFTDDYTRDRGVRLHHPQPHSPPTVTSYDATARTVVPT